MRVVLLLGLIGAAVTLMVVWPLAAILSFSAAALIALTVGWNALMRRLDRWLDADELRCTLGAMDRDYKYARRRIREIGGGYW